MDLVDRARLSLLGLATGDSFGETLVGDPVEVATRVAKRLISVRWPWRWTDDTAMASSIVEVLGRRGEIDPTTSPPRSRGAGAKIPIAATARAPTTCSRV